MYRDTHLTLRTISSTGSQLTTRPRTAQQLRAGDSAVVTVAGVTVLVPSRPVSDDPAAVHAGMPVHFLTPRSGPPGWTQAAVAVNLVHAGRPERARRRLTLVNVDATVGSGEARSTLAPVPVIPIHACPGVVARVWVAVIRVLAAGESLPAFLAHAGEAVTADDAGSAVLARVGKAAAVFRDITARSFPARGTHAFEGVSFIAARTAVVTRRLVALAFT